MNSNGLRFWLCIIFATLDLFLAIVSLPEIRPLFIACGACFVFGAVVSYLHGE